MGMLNRLIKLASGEIEGEIKQIEYSLAADAIKQLQLEKAKLREALKESNALNINWSSDAEPYILEYYSEYRKVIKQSEEALGETK